jgi:hypothetical protein
MVGKKVKTGLAAIAVVVCLANSAFGGELPSGRENLERSALERLLGNHPLINIVDDFLVFWDQARDKPLRIQRRIWRRTVEKKHHEYFEKAVYRGADRTQRLAMLNEFLIRVPERVEAIRELNRTITDNLIVAFIHFKDFRFRDYQHQRAIYFGLSFFGFDGAVRPVQNDLGIPDTLCLGAEVLARYTPEQLRVTLTHEFFHLYHFSFLFKHPGVLSSEFRLPHIPLLIEGMAVAGVEQAYAGQSIASYLHFSDEELASQRMLLGLNAVRFLDLIRSSAPPIEYERWFTQNLDGQVPTRGGYLLGYEVVKRLLEDYSLEQMVAMSPAELRAHAEEQLAAISGYRVLLMSPGR